METRKIEFFVSSLGVVYFYTNEQEIKRYDMEQAELIKFMAQMIEKVYPDAYAYLYHNFIKSEKISYTTCSSLQRDSSAATSDLMTHYHMISMRV